MSLQVFISYKSEYRDFARAVKGQLLDWGYQTWLDVDNIQPGDYFRHKIQQGLDASDVLLMVLTEEAQLSREVMAEVDYFLDVAKKPVVPLRHRECKPLYIFVSIQYIDFVTDQLNGFVQLKQRLTELATDVSGGEILSEQNLPKPGASADAPAEPDKHREAASSTGVFGAIGGGLPEPEPAEVEEVAQEQHKKEDVLDDLLLKPPAPITPASPPPPVPQQTAQPSMQPPSSTYYQQERQQPYMPQPAPRRKSNPLQAPVLAAASLILVVLAVVLLNSGTGKITPTNIPPTSVIPTSNPQNDSNTPLIWIGLVLILVSGSVIVGYFAWRRFGRSQPAASTPTSSIASVDVTRDLMLQKVEDMWLKDLSSTATTNLTLRHKDYPDYTLPSNTNIVDVFNDLNRELLILGTSGSGRTTLLLQLTRMFVNQARQDRSKAIPVVFNLASWAAGRKPLADWLMNELRQQYQVSQRTAQSWVEGEELLLILDGLAEISEPDHSMCTEAIHDFRQRYRTVDLALCGSTADYDVLTSKLDIRGAIVVQ